jgi:hypothetical protein
VALDLDIDKYSLEEMHELLTKLAEAIQDRQCGKPTYYNPHSDSELSHACMLLKGHEGDCA